MTRGQIIFNNASTAASAHVMYGIGRYNLTICRVRRRFDRLTQAETIFNDTSSADHASISNNGAGASHGGGGQTIFNDTSTAANASIDNLGSGVVSHRY